MALREIKDKNSTIRELVNIRTFLGERNEIRNVVYPGLRCCSGD